MSRIEQIMILLDDLDQQIEQLREAVRDIDKKFDRFLIQLKDELQKK